MTQQITVGSQAERDEVVARFLGQHYRVKLSTSTETRLARERFVFSQDYPKLVVATLMCVVPGVVYYLYLLFRPLPEVVVLVRGTEPP